MHNEIIGPEMKVITGQTHFLKNETVARHIVQYSTPSNFSSEPRPESKEDRENRIKADQVRFHLQALELTDSNFFTERDLRKELTEFGVPDALTDNWLGRRKSTKLQELKKRAKQNDCDIAIPSLENIDKNVLELEMNAMLKVLHLPKVVENVIREVK